MKMLLFDNVCQFKPLFLRPDNSWIDNSLSDIRQNKFSDTWGRAKSNYHSRLDSSHSRICTR